MSDRSSSVSFSSTTLNRRGLVRVMLPIVVLSLAASPAFGAIACKPVITVKRVHISESAGSQRLWTAELAVDARTCASTSGSFEMDFVRLKETAPDLQFTEHFTWRPGKIEVSLDIWIDEAIPDFRVGFVPPCVCPELPF